MSTCMMEAKDLNPNIWDETVKFVAYVQNIFLHKALKYKTPFEA